MAAEPDVQPAEADTGGLMGIIRGSIPQIILIYALSTALVAFRGGANGRGSSSATHAGGAGVSPLPVVNGFLGEVLELRVYMTEREAFAEFEDAAALVWTQPFTLGGPAGMLSGELAAINLSYVPSAALLRNESAVWAHLFLTRAGFSPDPRSAMYAAFATVDRHHSLVQYRQTGGNKKLKSLLGGSGGGGARAAVAVDGDDDEEAEAPRRSPFWKPLLSIAICSDGTPFPTPAAMPEPLAEHLALRTAPLARLGALSGGARVGGGAGAGGESGVLDAGAAAERTVYLPRPFVNELWLSANQLVAINASLAHGANQKAEIRRAPAASAAELVAAGALPLVLELHTVSLLKISLYAQLGKTLSAQADKGADGISGAASAEEFRRLVTETNPYLLLVTVVVTVLHSLFDFLAFRNEVKCARASARVRRAARAPSRAIAARRRAPLGGGGLHGARRLTARFRTPPSPSRVRRLPRRCSPRAASPRSARPQVLEGGQEHGGPLDARAARRPVCAGGDLPLPARQRPRDLARHPLFKRYCAAHRAVEGAARVRGEHRVGAAGAHDDDDGDGGGGDDGAGGLARASAAR